MKKIPFVLRLKYSFDNTMSKGTPAMIAWLGIVSLLIVLVAGFFLFVFEIYPEGEEPLTFYEAFWRSLMRTLDPGTMGGDVGWGYRIVQFLVTLGGIFIISTLIGVLSNGIESILERLRKGRSFVIENNHTLILGWSSKIFTIISELTIANENQKKPRIVILADKDKVAMEDEIREKVPNTKNTKVICRSGNPNDMIDICMVNPQESKSVIILSGEDETADSETIKSILAITNNPNRRPEPYHIVAEIKEEKNIEVAKMIGKDEVELVLTDDIVARIMTQTCRQTGLSVVYTELLDFDGDEIYFNEEDELVGKTYSDALFSYKDSSVIGFQLPDGKVEINPEINYTFNKGDKIIAITKDDDTLIVDKEKKYQIDEDAINNEAKAQLLPEKTIILGWNKQAQTIVKEIDNYSVEGSEVKIVSTFKIPDEERNEILASVNKIKIEFDTADTTSRLIIDSLNITMYDHVLLLSYKDEFDIQKADSVTLITLLHLRRISEDTNSDINIVSEMMDSHNRELAEVTKADDFIVSDKIISLLMTQVSENKYLMKVFTNLFESEGSEVYLKPALRYVKENTPVNFYTVLESAKRKGETAIGYRISSYAFDSSKSYGVVVNPVKSEQIKFTAADKIIVISED